MRFRAKNADQTVDPELGFQFGDKATHTSRTIALDLAIEAKRLGLLDLRVAGDVFDLNLDRLDPRSAGGAR